MSRLSQYFQGVVIKRLSAVETDPKKSNQHEFNGIKSMVSVFGENRNKMDCLYLYLGDEEEQTISSQGFMTWYDSRENHITRTEYRVYCQTNPVMEMAKEGDLLIIGKRIDGSVLCLVVRKDSTYERQTLWLFNVNGENNLFTVGNIEGETNKELGYAGRTILESLGIDIKLETEETDWIAILLKEFGTTFPSTRIFSAFARNTLSDVSSLDNPDIVLLAWIDQEEMLFRTLERHIVQQRIDQGFDDVDSFVSFSLSVHNRRKSRMGYALENHLEQIFLDRKISYAREKVTEYKSKPDFVFPGIEEYHTDDFPVSKLTMLGAKSSCKDRWRQVLAEAKKIEEKHLLTLEPGISENQTTEMQAKKLQLVLPQEIHETYLPDQQNWLINLSDFLSVVQEKAKIS